MRDQPNEYADRPVLRSREVLAGDAFSEVLHAIHLRGYAVSLHHGHGPEEPALETDVRAIHLIGSGEVTLRGAGLATTTLAAGDLALLPLGTVHRLYGEPDAHWVSGIFRVDDAVAEPFLAVLPPLVVVRGNEPGRAWLPLSRDLLRQELVDPRAGGRVMVSRILDLLFIHALREWSASADHEPGVLTAALDPDIGRALAALHADPAHPWSVAELARRATLSRSGFAARFTRLVGQTPVAYLTHVRLDLATELLRGTDLPVSRVAEQAGYASEAAFIRAFQRRMGSPPGRWRRTHDVGEQLPRSASGLLP